MTEIEEIQNIQNLVCKLFYLENYDENNICGKRINDLYNIIALSDGNFILKTIFEFDSLYCRYEELCHELMLSNGKKLYVSQNFIIPICIEVKVDNMTKIIHDIPLFLQRRDYFEEYILDECVPNNAISVYKKKLNKWKITTKKNTETAEQFDYVKYMSLDTQLL